MIRWTRSQLRTLHLALRRLQAQGHGLAASVLFHLPMLVARRGYRKIAQWIDGRVLTPLLDSRRFRWFLQSLARPTGKRFYVIVMPGTLHFLLPCLQLLPRHLDVVLLHNGTTQWERDLVQRIRPDLPTFRLATLPGSSVAHGDVLTLLLGGAEHDFGVIDHDLYLFDETLFDRLEFGKDECVLAPFGSTSSGTGLAYPLTYFLYFKTAVWRDLMVRHGVTARLYRHAPKQVQGHLADIGLADGVVLKDYHDFFDTLHLLLAIAYSEGYRARFVALSDADDAIHVGGTSIGLHQTKELGMVYVNARFLELGCNAMLRGPYRHLLGRFENASGIRPLLPRTPETYRMLTVLDRLMARLEATARQSMAH